MKSILVEPGKPAALVDISPEELSSAFDILSCAFPFEDDVAFAHSDNGIAEGLLPNRTVNGEIIPGPFYIISIDSHGAFCSLPQELCLKYLSLYAIPEHFGPGRWKVTSSVEETEYTAIIRVKTEWVVEK